MEFKVFFSEPALIDLEQFVDYSNANFLSGFEHYGPDLLNHIVMLRDFPRIRFPCATGQLVEVLHVWHGKRRRAKLR